MDSIDISKYITIETIDISKDGVFRCKVIIDDKLEEDILDLLNEEIKKKLNKL